VNTYFSVQDAPAPSAADVIQPAESVVPASAPTPTPVAETEKKAVAFEADADAEDDDDEDLDEETDDEHPKIHLSDETLELDLGADDDEEEKKKKKSEEKKEDDSEVNLTPEEGEGLVLKV
jgi:hypothetical protein